jgi:hypothetical protein
MRTARDPRRSTVASRFRGLNWTCPLLLVGLLGCGKSSPTEPAASNTLFFHVTISNTTGRDTLQNLVVSLDDLVVAGNQTTHNYSIDNFSFPQLSLRGRHKLTLTIASQSESPSPYAASVDVQLGNVHYPSGVDLVASVTLPLQTATLATGDSITWTFDI